MKKVKKAVSKFWIDYSLYDKNLTLESLNDILISQGFVVIYFGIKNPVEVQSVIDNLGVARECEEHDGFTYCSKKLKAVFVNKSLNDADKFSVLMHEEGHIFLEHFSHSGIIEHTHTRHESEANAFALMLTKKVKRKNFYQYLNSLISNVSPLSVKILIASLILFCSSIYCLIQYSPNKDNDSNQIITESTITQSDDQDVENGNDINSVFYWTEQGTVYHIYQDCYHIRNSENVLSGTLNICGKERCCSACTLRKLKENNNKLN